MRENIIVIPGQLTDIGETKLSVIIKGDLNGDNVVDLTDAILALQVLSGLYPAQLRADYAISGTDVNGNGKIGLEEAVHSLRVVAE